MKIERTILSLAGLIFLFIAYYFQNVAFLLVAVIAFFLGLFLMGIFRKPPANKEKPSNQGTGKGKKQISREISQIMKAYGT